MTTDARHLKLVTGGTDSERSDTYSINMGPNTEDLVSEYRQIRSEIMRNRNFRTMAKRAQMPALRRRAMEIVKILKARGVDVS